MLERSTLRAMHPSSVPHISKYNNNYESTDLETLVLYYT